MWAALGVGALVGAAVAGAAAALVRLRYPAGAGPSAGDGERPGALPLLSLGVALGGGLGALSGLAAGGLAGGMAMAAVLALLAVLSLVDLERRLLPDILTLPGCVMAMSLSPYVAGGLRESLLGGGVAFAVALLVYLLPFGYLGAGDVKLAAFLGFALGFPRGLDALAAGALLGGVGALVYMLRPAPAGEGGGSLLQRAWRRRHEGMPYGPFLAAGGAVVLLGGGLWS